MTLTLLRQFNVLESLPAYSCVAVSTTTPDGLLKASSTDVEKIAFGVVTEEQTSGVKNVTIVTYGFENPAWSWDISLGRELYCGPSGELVQGGVITNNVVQKVGMVLVSDNLYLNSVSTFN